MGAYKDIRDAIVTELQSVQVSSANAFVEVATEPKTEFTGYPAAAVIPNQIDSEYLTVADNQRGYGFTVLIHNAKTTDQSAAIDATLNVVDAVLDALDQSIDLGGVCDFLRAVPVMSWDPDTLTLLPMIEVVAIKRISIR